MGSWGTASPLENESILRRTDRIIGSLAKLCPPACNPTGAVAWGPARCRAFAFFLQTLGAGLRAGYVLVRHGPIDGVTGILVQLTLLARFARRFAPRRIQANYRAVMRMNIVAAVALGG